MNNNHRDKRFLLYVYPIVGYSCNHMLHCTLYTVFEYIVKRAVDSFTCFSQHLFMCYLFLRFFVIGMFVRSNDLKLLEQHVQKVQKPS